MSNEREADDYNKKFIEAAQEIAKTLNIEAQEEELNKLADIFREAENKRIVPLKEILNVLGYDDIVVVDQKPPKEKRSKRTKEKSYNAGAISNLPEVLAMPGADGYQDYMSLQRQENAKAYLELYNANIDVKIKGSKLYIKSIGNLEGNQNLREYSEVDLQNLQTREGISKIDTPLLRYLYSIIWKDFVDNGCNKVKDIIIVNAQELAEKIGIKGHISKDTIDLLLEKIKSFHHIVGVMPITRNGKPDKSYYQVLNFEYYDVENNNIAFSSPYMNKVIGRISSSLKRKPLLEDNTKQRKNNINHMTLIDSSLVSKDSYGAFESLVYIEREIAKAESNIIKIPAISIVNHNEQLKERMENSKNPTIEIQRSFKATWKLIKSDRILREDYKNIGVTTDLNNIDSIVPIEKLDPTNPSFIPTKRSLYSMVFCFLHQGKNR